jgi:MinD-like ATPase involved in chromosome partitioning or flagellar assembly
MSKIISVHSYRGGTGKSNFTANIATAVASQGYRVGIVDTDLQSPGIHVLFGLNEEKIGRTLNDFLWGRCPIVDTAHDVTAILEDQGTSKSKVYLVPSSIKINDISRILREGFDVELLFEGFQTLIKKLKLDYLFIDTHPGLNEETLLSLTLSDIVLIILRPDQQDFQGTAVTVEVARKLNVPQLRLMVNKALSEYNFEQLRQQVEKTYNVSVVGVLPESNDLIKLASNGIFWLKNRKHPITKVISEVADHFIKIGEKKQGWF